jgi:hypothetical protein
MSKKTWKSPISTSKSVDRAVAYKDRQTAALAAID